MEFKTIWPCGLTLHGLFFYSEFRPTNILFLGLVDKPVFMGGVTPPERPLKSCQINRLMLAKTPHITDIFTLFT